MNCLEARALSLHIILIYNKQTVAMVGVYRIGNRRDDSRYI